MGGGGTAGEGGGSVAEPKNGFVFPLAEFILASLLIGPKGWLGLTKTCSVPMSVQRTSN